MISGSTIAVAGPHAVGKGGCPCNGGLGLFTEPPGGWSGELTTSPIASTPDTDGNGSIPLAIDGRTLFAGGQFVLGSSTPNLDIFNVTQPIPESPPHPPSAADATLTGLATGKPRLELKLSAGSNAAPIQSVTITAPTGLSFSHNRKQLARGLPNLATRTGKYSVTVKRNKLILTFTYPGNRPPLTIAVPALRESAGLITKKPPKINIRLRVDDAAGRPTTLVMKPSRPL